MEFVEVHDARIPKLGFGTFELDGDTARRILLEALDAGYRHIDTAQMYGNESEVGDALRCSDIPRNEIFLTTKVWPDRFRNGVLQRSVEESLERLDTDYVDLLLLHWPNPDVPLQETVDALNDAREKGYARHIGISNFTVPLIREAAEYSAVPLVTNQIEYHPYLSQHLVMQELRRQGMALTAYAPLGRGRELGDESVQRIADRHHATPAQVVLRWHYQQPNMIAVPRSSKAERVRENLDIFGFELSDAEMTEISALARTDGRLISPAEVAPAWD